MLKFLALNCLWSAINNRFLVNSKSAKSCFKPWCDFVLCLDADLLLAWCQYVGYQGAAQARLGCVSLFDIFYDRGDGSLQMGQKVDSD